MKLFLSSIFSEVSSIFWRRFRPAVGTSVAFIPTASVVEDDPFWVDAARAEFRQMGFVIHELELSVAAPEDIEKTLAACDMIYVSGGNTFFLLDQMKKTGADKLIAAQIAAGKPYIGESAGTAVLAPTIEYVKEMDDPAAAPELSGFDAMGVVDFLPMPHYQSEPYAQASERAVDAYSERYEIMAFKNDECLYVEDGKMRLEKAKKKHYEE